MASHHSLFSFAALAVTFSIAILSSFSLIEALNGGFSVDLIHRDSPGSPFYNPSETHSQHVSNALRRSILRISNFNSTSASHNAPRSEIATNRGEYLMKYSVGTPPTPILGIADTGSDLIWLQCKPCTQCYKQTIPLFNPRTSKTYKNVACSSRKCESLEGNSCLSNNRSSCTYSVAYGDRSFSNGDLAVDTLTLGSTTGRPVSFPKTVIGCGHNNDGTFDEKGSGIVGLGGGALSLVSQLGSSIGGKFSYCLVPYLNTQGKNSSKLNFGNGAVVSGSGAVSTRLVKKKPDTFYFLTLEAISVGNKRLELGGSSSSSRVPKGNIIIDSGTTLTLLPPDFYSEFESAVAKEIDSEPVRSPIELLNLCYNISESDDINGPSITAHFKGADVKLSEINTFVRLSEELLCFAFSPHESLSIFGNIAQMNFLVGYDLKKKAVSFKPADCTKL